MSVADLFEDAHVQARANIVRLAAPVLAALGGSLAMPGVVPKLSATPGRIDAPGPATPGQDNEAVYGERLGIGRAELARLRERGVI